MGSRVFPASQWPHLPIRTRRLTLRLPEFSDAPAIRLACDDPTTRWGIRQLPRPYRLEDAIRFVRRSRTAARRRQSLHLAIALPNGPLAGMIGFGQLSVTDRVAGLGYWIAPAFRRRGYATEAARAMCDVGFRVLRLHRIEASALARNRASLRVLQRAGLQREGVLRQRDRIGPE